MNVPPLDFPCFFLKPGEIFIAEQPCVVSTLLGSCVAVALFSRTLSVGAICHAFLPSCRPNGPAGCRERFRHVECAITGMLEELDRRGVPQGTLEAKIFGGAEMFGFNDGGAGVGRQNIVMARKILEAEGIRVTAADLEGTEGRKIFFYPHTGEVFLRRLDRIAYRQARGYTAT